jgi:hypothetical protein
LLALPAYYTSWLPPDTAKLLELLLLFNLVFALSLNISRIAVRPLVTFGRLSWTLGAPDMVAGLAGGSCGRDEQGLALVAGAPDSLCGRLVRKLVAMPGGDSQDLLLLLGLLNSLLLLNFLTGCLLLGVPRALLAALVLALHAHLFVSIEGATAVAASVHAHTDGLLHTRDQGSRSRRSDPLMRLKSQSVFGKQSAGTLLLHGIAVECWGGLDECGCFGGSWGGAGGSEVRGGSRTEIPMISSEPYGGAGSTHAAAGSSVGCSCLIDPALAGFCAAP